jgi:drug/metabolite transporter (DMT)-like permease
VTLQLTAARQRSTLEAGIFAGSIAVMAWGLGPLLVKGMGMSTPTVVAYRFIFAVPVMHLAARWRGASVTRETYRIAAVPGVIFGVSMMLGFAAVLHTSVSNATLIGNMLPVVVLLVARFVMKERVPARQFWMVGLAVIGVVVVVIGGGSNSNAAFLGDALALINLGLWSTFFLKMKNLRDQGANAWSLLAAVTTIAALVAVPPSLLMSNDLTEMTPTAWWCVIAMVLLPGLLGHGLMTWASGHLPVTVSSLMTLASPVVSAVGAWLWLGESMNVWQGLGSVIVLTALAVIVVGTRSQAVQDAVLSDRPE